MSGAFTKSMARNIFYGGSVFFLLLFLAMSFDTSQALPKRDRRELLNPQVEMGKKVWEENDCIGCHTLMGEGAYYAPELVNVYQRRGGDFIKTWLKIQPSNVPGRRQMPQFNLSEEELDALVAFLKYSSQIDTANWPPNIEG